MLLKTYLTFFSFLLFLGTFAQQSFEKQFDSFISNDKYQRGNIGAMIFDLDSKKELFAYNHSISMVPGSLLKLVTSGAALEILGEDYRFETSVSYSGELKPEGQLDGNLIIKGGGDPTLGSKYFEAYFLAAWIEKIKSKGIKRINGNIVLDISDFENQTVPDTWIWEDIGNYYGAGAGAFSIYDNTLKITFSSGKDGSPSKIIRTEPHCKDLKFKNQVLSSNKKSDQAYVYGSPWIGEKIIRGTIPKNRNEFTIKAALPNPELVLGNELKEKLNKAGIIVEGKISVEIPKQSSTILFTHKSVPLRDIIRILNHESVNLIAEHLVKQVAKETNGYGSSEEGLKIIKQHWGKNGMDTRGLFMEDGSGLSHFDAITATQFSYLLNYMYSSSPVSNVYKESLATAGKGTLYVFSKKDFPGNTLRCKSGSMTRVRCYAGYLKTDSNRNISFVFMVNNFEGRHLDVIKEIERLLLSLKHTI